MTMFGMWMPENAQSSVVEQVWLKRPLLTRKSKKQEAHQLKGTSPWMSVRKITKSRGVKIIDAAAKFQWWEK